MDANCFERVQNTLSTSIRQTNRRALYRDIVRSMIFWRERSVVILAFNNRSRCARTQCGDTDPIRGYSTLLTRVINKQVQADPSVTNTQRADAGLPVYSTTRNPVPVPTTAPMVHLEAANVQQHVFRFTSAVDAHANVRSTGVKSIQIFGAFDTAPVSDSDFELLGSTTRMNATLNFPISDAGKSIWYRFRYLNTKDQPGPWTTTLAAIILK